MKTMTCKQLGGACELAFSAATFEEMIALSKQHGMEMFQKGDAPHLEAMQAIKKLMDSPEAMERYFNEKRALFEQLPSD